MSARLAASIVPTLRQRVQHPRRCCTCGERARSRQTVAMTTRRPQPAPIAESASPASASRPASSCRRSAGASALRCRTAMSRNSSPSAAWKQITSPSDRDRGCRRGSAPPRRRTHVTHGCLQRLCRALPHLTQAAARSRRWSCATRGRRGLSILILAQRADISGTRSAPERCVDHVSVSCWGALHVRGTQTGPQRQGNHRGHGSVQDVRRGQYELR
jgi:hypothetical protein